MTFGIKITNDDGYMTFTDTHDYLTLQEKLTSTRATYDFGNRFHWTTTYNGSAFPLVFIESNGYWASVIDTFRNANGTWQIHVWCNYNQATNTLNNITGYCFVQSSQYSASDPAYGIRINDASGNRVYNSDFELPRVKGFSSLPAITASTPSCGNSSTSVYLQTSVTHGVSGLTKPAATLYSSGSAFLNCSGGFRYWKSGYKITSTQVLGGWMYAGQASGFTVSPSPYNSAPPVIPLGIIDGNDY